MQQFLCHYLFRCLNALTNQWREYENLLTPCDIASWLYHDTLHETAAQLEFMIERGVDPLFAIETKKYRPVIWFPSRAELEAAGILRD